MSDLLDQLALATAHRRDADDAAHTAHTAWLDALHTARDAGYSLTEIARVCEITPQRVSQLLTRRK